MCERRFRPVLPSRKVRRISATLVLALLVTVACQRTGETPEEERKPDGILLISIEAIRRGDLSVYGGPVAVPSLERLAGMSVAFDDAATVCPMTRPSAATLLTGVAPDRTGVRNDVYDRLPPEFGTLAEKMQEAGRETVAVVGTPFVSYSSGLARGFGLFDGPEELAVGPQRYYPAVTSDADVAERFGQWLGSLDSGRSFFAWVHLAGLHGLATAQESVEDSAGAYREALGGTDEAVGKVLDALVANGRLDRTMVVLVGTHGVLLGEDGLRGGAYWLRPETVGVPLVIKSARGDSAISPGSRSAAKAWLPDVAATLAARGGVTLDEEAEGIDLLGATDGIAGRTRTAWSWARDDEIDWPALTSVEGPSGWRSYGWDALAAPGERGDAPAAGPLDRARLRPARPRVREIPPELKARIEAAGILDSWEEADSPRLAPAVEAAFLTRLQRLRHLFNEEPGKARKSLRNETRKLLEDYPGNHAAVIHRLYFLLLRGASKRVGQVSEPALRRWPEREEILHWAAHVALMRQDLPTGELLLEASIAVAGREPELLYDLACVRALRGDADGAVARLEEAIGSGYRNWHNIEQDPDLASVRTHPRYVELMRAHGR